MHKFLRCIGFSEVYTNHQQEQILKTVIDEPTSKTLLYEDATLKFIQYTKEVSPNMGLSVLCEYENGTMSIDSCYPYYQGTTQTVEDSILYEGLSSSFAFLGYCDDYNIGITLIFHIINIAAIVESERSSGQPSTFRTVSFSGLSMKGSILFEISKDEDEIQFEKQTKKKRQKLIAKAKTGDITAINKLNNNDINAYNFAINRCQSEDIYSIVDTYFMPYGIECDQYSVLGNIMNVIPLTNHLTNEALYKLTVNCNDITFDVIINQKDLLGEPKIGRRFKGVIWMQGFLEPDSYIEPTNK